MESGKASLLDSHTVNVQSQGHVVDMVHFDTGTLFDIFIYKLIVKNARLNCIVLCCLSVLKSF